MNERRWKATWRDQKGYLQEYLFYAPDSRVLARIDFQLRLMEQGRPVPNVYELEEGTLVVQVVPRISTLRR